MNEHRHIFNLKKYEHGIDRGECACGAVKFYPMYLSQELLAKVKELDEKFGAKGTEPEKPRIEEIKEKRFIDSRPAKNAKEAFRPKLNVAREAEKIEKEENKMETNWPALIQEVIAEKANGKGHTARVAQRHGVDIQQLKAHYMIYLKAQKPPSQRPNHQPKKEGINRQSKHRYIEEHKSEILTDAQTMKLSEVCKKWGIGKTVIFKMRAAEPQTKTVKTQTDVMAKPVANMPINMPVHDEKVSELQKVPNYSLTVRGIMPPFPAFNEKWSFLFKIVWLITYGKVAIK